MTFGDCLAVFKTQTEASNVLKPSSRRYRAEVLNSILESWPGLEALDVRRISANDCNTWAAKFSHRYSATRFNGAVGVLRADVQSCGGQRRALSQSSSNHQTCQSASPKSRPAPSREQFELFVKEITKAPTARDSHKLRRTGALPGLWRLPICEARNITWADCDFKKKRNSRARRFGNRHQKLVYSARADDS